MNDNIKNNKFITGVNLIRQEQKPISLAWRLACNHVNIEDKIKKIIFLIEEHENIFFSNNKYHNQYLLAETIWSSAWLGAEEFIDYRNSAPKVFQQHMIITFLIATFFNAQHNGKPNRLELENEKNAELFFRQWWGSNSLFFEKGFDLNSEICESIIADAILKTEKSKYFSIINKEYINNKNTIKNNLKINAINKIISEAMFLTNMTPQFAFLKAGLLLEELRHKKTPSQIWEIILNLINQLSPFFISDASKKLKLKESLNEFNYTLNSIDFSLNDKINDVIDEKINGLLLIKD